MTAADFARLAVQMTQTSDRIKPTLAEDAKYANARNLAVYHLRMAAKTCREISEAMAAQEPKA